MLDVAINVSFDSIKHVFLIPPKQSWKRSFSGENNLLLF